MTAKMIRKRIGATYVWSWHRGILSVKCRAAIMYIGQCVGEGDPKGRSGGREGNRGPFLHPLPSRHMEIVTEQIHPGVNTVINLVKYRIQGKKNRPSKRC